MRIGYARVSTSKQDFELAVQPLPRAPAFRMRSLRVGAGDGADPTEAAALLRSAADELLAQVD